MLTVSAHYIQNIIVKLSAMGVSQDMLISCTSHDELMSLPPMQAVNVEDLIAVYEAASNVLSITDIGLAAGQKFDMATLHETGKILPSCATFKDAMMMVSRYHRLTQTFAYSRVVISGNNAILEWLPYYQDHERFRQLTSAVCTGFVSGAKWLLWGKTDFINRVEFRGSEPEAGAQIYEQVYGCPVCFSCDRDGVIFNANILDTPLSTADSDAFDAIGARLDKMLVQYDTENSVLERVRLAIRMRLSSGESTAEYVATVIGLSVRSLRYALQQSGTNFRQEVENIRKEICLRLMARKLPLLEISFRLGYSDQSAFNRAFRHWYGQSPKAFQNEVLRNKANL